MKSEVEGKKTIKKHYYFIATITIWLLLNIKFDFFNQYHLWNGESFYDQSGFGLSMVALFCIMIVMFGIWTMLNKEKLTGIKIFKNLRIDGIGATIIMIGITLLLAIILYTMIIIV